MSVFDATHRQLSLGERLLRGIGSFHPSGNFGRSALNSTSAELLYHRVQARATALADTMEGRELLPDEEVTTAYLPYRSLPSEPAWPEEVLTAAQDDSLRAVDWSARQPEEITAAIQLALTTQDFPLARELAAVGHERYPEQSELATLNYVLAPPVAKAVTPASRPDMQADFDWLRENRERFQGRWVALLGGQLLATADTVADLMTEVGDVRNTDILITQVW